MKILIIGGAGMIGRKLFRRLAKDEAIEGKPISSVTLFDVVAPAEVDEAAFPVEVKTGDLSDQETAAGLVVTTRDGVEREA